MIIMERYRIELVRVGDERDEVLVALEGSAELVGRMAGGLVAEAVGAERAATTVVMPGDVPNGDDEKPKRTRRTKAQIAADETAQALGFRDAAHQAEAGGHASSAGGAPADESAPAAPPAPAQVAVPQEPPAAPYDPFAPK